MWNLKISTRDCIQTGGHVFMVAGEVPGFEGFERLECTRCPLVAYRNEAGDAGLRHPIERRPEPYRFAS